MSNAKLNHTIMGPDQEGYEGAVVVFLHGFAGDLNGWANLQIGLSSSVRSIAFDLPGHGKSLDYPDPCNAVVAAKAVMADMKALGLSRVHLVGHSMGGAVAALIALREPSLVASLTLIAPGGFGYEINQSLLRNYAKAADVDTIHMLLEQFFGWEFEVPRALAEHEARHRTCAGALEALQATAEAIIDGKVQKVLPLEELGKLSMPIKVIWGTQDRVLPTRHSHKLPPMIAVHVFDRVGHMPHLEVGRGVLALIRQNITAGRTA
ncbi:alpha/beta fold hydrolase [Cohaesibacter intestini]|uniref:alpha/beta fold hydrolase n=1 Tax=Cohaesibacter intestini TaxID=2211145 RepID=UPI000DEBA543|nr:alpha/beta fold hydrolase [Cohaesibacter intestini]